MDKNSRDPVHCWLVLGKAFLVLELGIQADLQRAQGALQGASSHGKKKEIADANAQVSAAQKRVEEAHAKLDSIPKNIPVDIVKPYTYTEKDIELTAVVQLIPDQ